MRQFYEHTAQSVPSGGKLWIFVESRLEVIPVCDVCLAGKLVHDINRASYIATHSHSHRHSPEPGTAILYITTAHILCIRWPGSQSWSVILQSFHCQTAVTQSQIWLLSVSQQGSVLVTIMCHVTSADRRLGASLMLVILTYQSGSVAEHFRSPNFTVSDYHDLVLTMDKGSMPWLGLAFGFGL